MSSFSDEGTVESCQTALPVCDSPDGHTVRSADAVVELGVAEAEQWAQLEANPRARQRGQAPDPARQAAGGDAAEVGTDIAATRQPRTDAEQDTAEQGGCGGTDRDPLTERVGAGGGRRESRADDDPDVGQGGLVRQHWSLQLRGLHGLLPEGPGLGMEADDLQC